LEFMNEIKEEYEMKIGSLIITGQGLRINQAKIVIRLIKFNNLWSNCQYKKEKTIRTTMKTS